MEESVGGRGSIVFAVLRDLLSGEDFIGRALLVGFLEPLCLEVKH
jgi:hypothetical protein